MIATIANHSLLPLLAELVRPERRISAGRRIAEAAGADELLILFREPDSEEFVLLPGFGATLVSAMDWKSLLAKWNSKTPLTTEFPLTDVRSGRAVGVGNSDLVLVFLGGSVDVHALEEVATYIPMLSGTFQAEQLRALVEVLKEETETARTEADQAMRAKDEFLSTLGHELRAPLNPVLMAAEAMQGDSGLPPEIREQAEIIRRNAFLEARLIDDLIDITKVRRGELKLMLAPVSVHNLLSQADEVVKSDDSGKQVTIEYYKNALECFVQGDAARLQQVFWNLLRNAKRFTPQGGRIQVVTDNPLPSKVLIQFTDSGAGIDAKYLPHVFDAFETAKAEGNPQFDGVGLGLAITRAIVLLHGGTIRAESMGRGKGSTFTVELPTTEKPANSDGVISDLLTPSPKMRLLLVEDHDSTREVLGRILGRAGHKVYAVASTQEALQIAASAGHFDAVISDLGLPDQSGFALMKMLQAKYRLPGIAISGFGADEDVVRAQEAGFSAHLTKPVAFEELRAALERVAAGNHVV